MLRSSSQLYGPVSNFSFKTIKIYKEKIKQSQTVTEPAMFGVAVIGLTTLNLDPACG